MSTPFKAKLVDAQTAAVARRAFGGPIDVRPLLPVFEEKIGDMMRRAVPPELRPRRDCSVHSHRQKAERAAQIDRVRDLLAEGASQTDVMRIMGIVRATARQYIMAAKA